MDAEYGDSMISLKSKTALVTGASSGMGREIARAFSAAGADVLAVGRNQERLDQLVGEIEEAGGRVRTLAIDLTEPGASERAVSAAMDQGGRLDVLANVAGVMELAPIEDTTLESLDRQYATNVRSPFALTQAALPALRETKGVIVFVSSLAAHAAFPDSSAYSATKGAVDAMARQMAVELAPDGVRLNAIAPGEIDTPMNAEFYESHPDWLGWIKDFTPARRLGGPEDVARVAVFLASDLAGFVYGVSVPVDGGILAR